MSNTIHGTDKLIASKCLVAGNYNVFVGSVCVRFLRHRWVSKPQCLLTYSPLIFSPVLAEKVSCRHFIVTFRNTGKQFILMLKIQVNFTRLYKSGTKTFYRRVAPIFSHLSHISKRNNIMLIFLKAVMENEVFGILTKKVVLICSAAHLSALEKHDA